MAALGVLFCRGKSRSLEMDSGGSSGPLRFPSEVALVGVRAGDGMERRKADGVEIVHRSGLMVYHERRKKAGGLKTATGEEMDHYPAGGL